VERLNADDAVMLWTDALWPQEIGAVVVLDGRRLLDAGGEVNLRAVRAVIEARLHRVPRLRQLLVTPGRPLGGPLWLDAAAFDLDEHLRVVPVPSPGDETALLETVERLRRQRLERSRPLWEICVLPGLAEDRIGLFVRMHHALADGIAGMATVATFLDPVPDPPADPPPPPWRPGPAPSARDLFVDNAGRRLRRIGQGLSTLTHPVRTVRRARAAASVTRDFLTVTPTPPTSLNRTIGADRRIALVRSRLDVVKEIAHRHHATVNDVLLTVTAGGLRALLSGRGEPVRDGSVRVGVPVTLRAPADRAEARGNLVGQFMLPLPVAVADPSERLANIATVTAERKATRRPSSGAVLGSRLARRTALWLLDRRPVNATSADLIGPAGPVYLAGAEVLEVFPVLPLMGTLTLGVGALSYAGQFTITLIADRDTYPDLDALARGVENELALLEKITVPASAARC